MRFESRYHVHCSGKLVLRRNHQASCAVEVWEEAEDECGWDCLDGVVDGCRGGVELLEDMIVLWDVLLIGYGRENLEEGC